MSALVFSIGALGQTHAGSANLHGFIRDSEGKPIAYSALVLTKSDSSNDFHAQSDAQGSYDFSSIPEGIYLLRATKEGYNETQVPSVFLKPSESKTIDLTLRLRPPVSSPQFFDEPQFTVAGVTDTTNLGGHGSDTVVRARDSLAKDTASLGGTTANTPMDSEAERSLRHYAKRTRELLAATDRADLHHQLGDIEEKLGDSLEAVRHYQRAAELDSSEPNLFDWGAELLLHHAPEPSIEVFSKANRLFPSSARILLGLGAAYFSRGAYDDAVLQISKASDLKPNDPVPYQFLGKIEQSQKTSSSQVLEKLHRWITIQPQSADANYYYALGLWKLRNSTTDKSSATQVESLLKIAIRLDPKHAAAELQLGIVHFDQGAYAEAIADFQKALALDPEMEEAHYRLAQAYRQTGNSEKSKEELRLYDQVSKQSAERQDRERHEIKQFVYTLRDHSQPAQ